MNLEQKKLEELMDMNILKNKKIAIIENDVNVDFLIKEITSIYKDVQIISFYNNSDHYSTLLKEFNFSNENIFTCFESNDYNIKSSTIIVDDFYTANKNNFNFKANTMFCIFRSNTFEERFLYFYDIIIECNQLRSGKSKNLDGMIDVYDRENVYANFKYKVKNNEIKYFL